MTCKQLGGACDVEFKAETFEEITDLSKKHVRVMSQEQVKVHLKAIEKMKELMASPDAMQKCFEDKRKEFESL